MDCSSGVSTMMSVKRDAGIRRAHKHALLKWDRGTLDGEGVHGPLRFFSLYLLYLRTLRPREGNHLTEGSQLADE